MPRPRCANVEQIKDVLLSHKEHIFDVTGKVANPTNR